MYITFSPWLPWPGTGDGGTPEVATGDGNGGRAATEGDGGTPEIATGDGDGGSAAREGDGGTPEFATTQTKGSVREQSPYVSDVVHDAHWPGVQGDA